MSNRIKSKGPLIQTREEAETVLGLLRAQVITRSAMAAERELELKAVDDRFKDELLQLGTDIQTNTEMLRAWADGHPEAFGTAKSLQMTHGVVGWRTGNPSLKPLSGFTWDRVLEKLRNLTPYKGFIRTKEEVDKAAILAMRDELSPQDLRHMGVRVVQEETFYVEPRIDAPDERQVVPAEGRP
ncbi:MAG: host-nuclease inhibitor Gam family protein [Verrucomicrobiae bacterium]|nr:host-nuclease inhibitor Gam family protein [Verrucomicrobiae bacterium]